MHRTPHASNGVETPYWAELNDGVLSVGPGSSPAAFATGLSAPNPTNAISHVEFSLDRAARTRATILDAAWQQVRALEDATFEPGSHRATWDGSDDGGHACPPGLYLYRIAAGQVTQVRRVMLVR